MMTPIEFIQLPENKVKEIFESGRGEDDISHVVRIKKANEVRTKIFKRSLVVLKEYRIACSGNGIETFDLYLTYRNHGLQLTIRKSEDETKVILIKKYEWKRNRWKEKSSWWEEKSNWPN